MAQFSTDHEFVQRQLTCKSVRKAGVARMVATLAIPIVLIFLLIGTCCTSATSTTRPPPSGAGVFTDARDIFPQFICNSIPAGVRGLMVVGFRSGAVELQLGNQRHGQRFVSDLYLPDPQEPGQGRSAAMRTRWRHRARWWC